MQCTSLVNVCLWESESGGEWQSTRLEERTEMEETVDSTMLSETFTSQIKACSQSTCNVHLMRIRAFTLWCALASMCIPIRIHEPLWEVVWMRICLTDPALSVITWAIITQLCNANHSRGSFATQWCPKCSCAKQCSYQWLQQVEAQNRPRRK